MSIAIDVNDMVVRTVDMPSMPVNEIRQVLRVNGKAFLQQELPNHVFDCCVFPASNEKSTEKTKAEGGSKTKVLVAGAKRALLDDIQTAIKNAGFVPDFVIPSIIGPVNAFENAMPEAFPNEVVALVDIGFKSSTISLLQNGRLILTRIVNMGGEKLTSGLAEMMNITYAEAEGIKIGMPGEVQPQLEVLVSPIGRELRASIDFFEHQQDRAVSAVYISGGTAQSALIVQAIQTELALECKTWNPTKQMQIDVPTNQADELEHVGPQLTVAIGTALTAI
jgi:type IV pilus assembly protein PilM